VCFYEEIENNCVIDRGSNSAYRITGIAYPHTLAYSDLYDEAVEIWEYNMYEFGYWTWGDI